MIDCTQCGVCQLACNNVMLLAAGEGARADRALRDVDHRLVARDPSRCEVCRVQVCEKVCPDAPVEGVAPLSADGYGAIAEAFAGHTTDEARWATCSSGGFVTSLLACLLDGGTFDGAIVVVKDPADPRRGRFRIIERSEELRLAASSIYSMVPLQLDLAEHLSRSAGRRLILVGRPCQITAWEKLTRVRPRFRDTVGLTVSLFCAWSISQRGVDFLLRMSGLGDGDVPADLEYRSGRWPGRFAVRAGGSVRGLPFSSPERYLGLNYFPTLTDFAPPACRTCADVLGEHADLAVGDAWNLGLPPRPHGYSLVLVRTPRGRRLLDESAFLGRRFEVDRRCDRGDVERSQGKTVRIKRSKVLAGARVEVGGNLAFRFAKMNGLLRWLVARRWRRETLAPLLSLYLRVFWGGSGSGAAR